MAASSTPAPPSLARATYASLAPPTSYSHCNPSNPHPARATLCSRSKCRVTPPAAPEERQAWLMRTVDEADELMYRAKRSGGDQVLAEAL